ncbi:MAG: 1,2-phenylacetyl-CoA epoxidase subunit PaaC [Candidatus Binatia bacterium]
MAEDALDADLAEYCLGLGDDRLVLGHRLSEWCGHLPIVEEELALGNVALDLLDQANLLLQRSAALEARGRTADQLAFFRGVREFRNLLLVEQPNGDFAFTIARQFLFDVFDLHLASGLEASADRELAAFATRAAREASYHLRHSREWILRLGDGTDESRRRVQAGLDALWTFTAEPFAGDGQVERLIGAGIVVDPERLRAPWRDEVAGTLREAGLDVPSDEQTMRHGGRRGHHGEVLDRMLCEMQVVARSFPGASW